MGLFSSIKGRFVKSDEELLAEERARIPKYPETKLNQEDLRQIQNEMTAGTPPNNTQKKKNKKQPGWLSRRFLKTDEQLALEEEEKEAYDTAFRKGRLASARKRGYSAGRGNKGSSGKSPIGSIGRSMVKSRDSFFRSGQKANRDIFQGLGFSFAPSATSVMPEQRRKSSKRNKNKKKGGKGRRRARRGPLTLGGNSLFEGMSSSFNMFK